MSDDDVKKTLRTLKKCSSISSKSLRKKIFISLESSFLKEKSVPLLFDTGAEVSVIPIESILFSKLEILKIKNPPEALQAIDGEIICLGIIYLPINIYGEEVRYDFKFHVVGQQDIGKMDKGILGYNILQATKAQINLEKMILNFTTLNACFPLSRTKNPLSNILSITNTADSISKIDEKIYSLNNEEIHSCLNNIDEHSTHSISLISDGQKAHTESNIIEQSPQTNSNFLNEQISRQIEPKKVSKILDGQSLRTRQVLFTLRLNHLRDDHKKELEQLIAQFSNNFYLEEDELPFFPNIFKHEIYLTNNEKPIYVKNYRFPIIHKEEVEKQTADYLKKGIIKKSKSPWNAPIWIVPKKHDASEKIKWCMVIDYRKLNEDLTKCGITS
ncbi:hypothetical protein PGB90_000940 [Kerria lacca]